MEISTIGAFESFLQWGPLGLAGMMLVLVIFALVTSELTPARASLLKTFLYVGAVCFVSSLVAQYMGNEGKHRLVISVFPNDLDGSGFPPPRVTVNGSDLDRSDEFFVVESTSLSIDVTRALGLYTETEEKAQTAEAKVSQTEAELTHATQQIRMAQEAVVTTRSELASVQSEKAEKEAKLRQAEDVITLQSRTLEEALVTTGNLETQLQTIASVAASPSLAAPATRPRTVAPASIKSIEREIQTLRRNIQIGTGVLR